MAEGEREKKKAIQYLVDTIPADTFEEIAEAIRNGGPDWGTAQHFGVGMFVRNVLRAGGFGDRLGEMDEIWTELIEKAVKEKLG